MTPELREAEHLQPPDEPELRGCLIACLLGAAFWGAVGVGLWLTFK